MSFEKKKRFGAEIVEVVQPSRCLLGGCVFRDEEEAGRHGSRDAGKNTGR
jgi:hypothetical protein